MDMNDMNKGNLLISYLFPNDNNSIQNINNEQIMKNELEQLVNSWKEKGYINRWIIAPDEVISDKLKSQGVDI